MDNLKARQREYALKHYRANREKYLAQRKANHAREKSHPETKEKNNVRTKIKRERIRDYVFSLKIGQSCKCGFSDPRALVWHHTDPVSKVDSIAALINRGSLKKIKSEIAKCILLCANCHAIEHAPKRDSEMLSKA